MRDITSRPDVALLLLATSVISLVLALALLLHSERAAANPVFGIVAIAAGGNHTCAMTQSGGVLCWGDNHYGQLGDGTSDDRTKPVEVSGLSSGVQSIAAGDNHTCAVLFSGGVKCWGYNRYGQLGNVQNLRNSIVANPLPLDVTGLEGAAQITAGAAHTCVVMVTQGVKCWGWDRRGQLGDGPGCPDYTCITPRGVDGLTSGVASIDAGSYHTCAVMIDSGAVKCWGQNDFGQLGANTGAPCVDEGLVPIPCAPSPVDVPGLTDVLGIRAGGIDSPPLNGAHTCARILSGMVKCWGANSSGQLGDGQVCGMVCQSPTEVSLAEAALAIDSGGQHSCATLNFGVVKCWGDNALGQLGDGDSPNNSTTPVDVCAGSQCGDGICTPEIPCVVLSGASSLALGLSHSCALISGGVSCWGSNDHGQLGDGGACGVSCDTPVPALIAKGSLPDLLVTAMRIELETGGSCAFTSTSLGVRVEFRNIGTAGAGTFVVDVDGVQQTVDGLAAGATSNLWFSGHSFPGDITVILDATFLVAENDEVNNVHTKAPPVPTLPPTCTSTPTQTARPPTITPTPQAARGDANCDRSVNSIDAALVLQKVAGLLSVLQCPAGGDANRDGQIDSIDAALILQHAAGLLPDL